MISKNAKSSLSISKTVSLAVKLMHPSISCNYLKSPNYVMEHQIVTLVLTNQTLNSNAQVSNWRCYCTIMMLLLPCHASCAIFWEHFLQKHFGRNVFFHLVRLQFCAFNFPKMKEEKCQNYFSKQTELQKQKSNSKNVNKNCKNNK